MERKRKTKKEGILKRGALFSLLFVMSLMPLQVSAAENLTKELVITASDKQDYKDQAEKGFSETIKENGKEYTLQDIQYEITETEYIDEIEKVLEVKGKPKQTITEDGTVYTLVKSEEKKQEPKAPQVVTAYDDYNYAVTEADVPSIKQVTATNELTGEEETVACRLTGITHAEASMESREMTITFSNYDAAYYEWNGTYIARNDETPPLDGYEDELLAYCDAPAGSVITEYHWTGEPYTVDGVVYRDAAATVERQISTYRATYRGEIAAPEAEPVYTATYTAPDENGRTELTVTATASYTQNPVPIFNYVVTGIIVALILGLIFLLLFLLAKRKRRKEEKRSGV